MKAGATVFFVSFLVSYNLFLGITRVRMPLELAPEMSGNAVIDTEGKTLICSLHPNDETLRPKGRILLFTQKSLEKCNSILKTRKLHQLKHSCVILPETVDESHGYHLACYRRFVALPKLARQGFLPIAADSPDSPKLTRSRVVNPKPSVRTGLFPSSCIFCGRCRKKYMGVEQKLVSAKTKALEERIRRYISWKKDKRLMTRLQGVDFAVKEVKYHGCCRLKYQKEAESIMRRQNPPSQIKSGYWHEVRRAGKTALEALLAHVQDEIIYEKKVLPLNDLKRLHGHLLTEYMSDQSEEVKVNWRLSEKIKSHFGNEVVVGKVKGMRGQMLYSSILSESDIARKVHENASDASSMIRDTALILRQEIKKATKTSLQADDLSIEDIEKGEIQTPKAVNMFFRYLIGGPDIRASQSTVKKNRIKSLSQDSVFCATSGKSKPSKHFILGIALKSLTGSRKVIEILNRLGHCASYHTIQEILTELTYSAHKNESLIPAGMSLEAEHGTGVAWDNFDRYVETESGANTLHDTVGIVYQVVPFAQGYQNSYAAGEKVDNVDPRVIVDTSPTCRRRRRSYEPHGLEIEPYRKKPRLTTPNLLHPSNYTDGGPLADYEQWKMDVLWMSSFALKPIRVSSMWVAWNSMLFPPHSNLHKVWYLPQINLSPTSRAVVVETMKRSQKICQESNRKTIAVTYDLAIAKMALQVQAEESPNFDNLFVALGSFHVELAFFSTLGKVVAESGGPAILNECGLLAKGSLKSFYKGKNYKRCKRVHEIFALSLEILHFESFLECCGETDEKFDLISYQLDREPANSRFEFTNELEEVFKEYNSFCQQTRSGEHGKTAKFWLQYVDIIHIYHSFSRSIRVGDLEGYISSILKMSNLFFALNHPNYARWLVKYHSNLILLPKTHPEVYKDFKKGWFAVHRSQKSFSSTPIDLALEQTINADAARGITFMTNSVGARQRWAESHYLRVSIISKLLEQLSLVQKEDVSGCEGMSRLQKNHHQVHSLVRMITDTLNPFAQTTDKTKLYNIMTGKSAPEPAEKFLLAVIEKGADARKKFIEECLSNPMRFERPIPRQKVATFASGCAKNKLTSTDGKLSRACMTRDVFGIILCHGLNNDVDIDYILSYPLSPLPLSLCHPDGSMQKSPKSALMKHLESRAPSTYPTRTDVTIIDAAIFLHLHPNLPDTFGGVARYLLRRIMGYEGGQIHFVTDKWIELSIKDAERAAREFQSTGETYAINGPSQKRPKNWLTALRNKSFKKHLIAFLIDFWMDSSMSDIFNEKILFANLDDSCYKFAVLNDVVTRVEVQQFHSTHAEADSRMFFHLSQVHPDCSVVLRTSDTDCLVIALGCKHMFEPSIEIWLEVGIQSNNSQRYINVNRLHEKLGESLCKALPFYHALTGCDYTASFCRRGKVLPLKTLERNRDFQYTFAALAVRDLNESAVLVLEKFVCAMYGKNSFDDVDELRVHIFMERYSAKPGQKIFSLAKKLDPSTMPPCHRVFIEKVKRTCLIAKRWMSSAFPYPPNDDPEEFGWILEGGQYRIRWFDGRAFPDVLHVSVGDEETDNENDDEHESEESSDGSESSISEDEDEQL